MDDNQLSDVDRKQVGASDYSASDARKIAAWIDHPEWDVLEDPIDCMRDIEICRKAILEGTLRRLESFPPLDTSSANANAHSEPVAFSNGDSSQPTHDLQSNDAKGRFANPLLLGVGGFGVVFRVQDQSLGIPVALKILRPSKFGSTEIQMRFREETRTVAMLFDPGIVRIFETGKMGELPYMTSTYFEGGSLAKRLVDKSLLFTIKQAVWFLSQVAKSIHYAHAQGIIHRDLKPANILLNSCSNTESFGIGFRPVVTDFGLAKRLDQQARHADLTKTGRMLGTTRYMSPEHVIGVPGSVNIASDIFSLGTILYELTVGKLPFEDDTEHGIRNLIANAEVRRPSAEKKGFPRDLEAILLKCLAREPTRRYESAHALLLDMERFLRGEPVEAEKPTILRRTVFLMRKHPVISGLAIFTVIANVAALVGLTWALQRETQIVERERIAKELESQSKQQEIQARVAATDATRQMVRLFSQFTDRMILGKPIVLDDFVPYLETAIALREKEIEANPEEIKPLHELSVLRNYAAAAYHRMRKIEPAIKERLRVLAILDDLHRRDPGRELFRFQKFYNHFALAGLFETLHQQDVSNSVENNPLSRSSAVKEYRSAWVQIESLSKEFPENLEYRDCLAAVYFQWAGLISNDDREECYRLLDESIAISMAIYRQAVKVEFPAKYAIEASILKAKLHLEDGQEEKALEEGQFATSLLAEAWKQYEGEFWQSTSAFAVYDKWLDILMKTRRWEMAIQAANTLDRYLTVSQSYKQHLDYEVNRILCDLNRIECYKALNWDSEREQEEIAVLEFVRSRLENQEAMDLFRKVLHQTPMPASLRALLYGDAAPHEEIEAKK